MNESTDANADDPGGKVAKTRGCSCGSTSCTGHHYRFARGPHRSERAAVLLETVKVASLGQISEALFEVGGRYRRAM